MKRTRFKGKLRAEPDFATSPIIIMRGNEIYARIGPADAAGKRPFGLLANRGLPDDLFDEHDAEQAAIDAGDCNDDVGVFQGEMANAGKRS